MSGNQHYDEKNDAVLSALSDDARSKSIERRAFIWNTVSGLIMAFQSMLMLIVLTRVCSVEVAGVFTIAFANANLFLSVGKFGMRNFQASDRDAKFSFFDYRTSRVVSTVAMYVAAMAYLSYSAITLNYSFDKIVAIVFMCFFKGADSVDDVYFGNFQQYGRLDIAGILYTIRLASSVALFVILAVVMRDLLLPLIITTVFTYLVMAACLLYAKRRFGLPVVDEASAGKKFDICKAMKLLGECIPLFMSSFLLFYIGNAPKYAIDAYMTDVDQAYYGYISMPVFVVGLFASFIYNPLVAKLTEMWATRQIGRFVKAFLVQVGIIVGITLVCDFAAFLIGIPVLDFLYNTSLAQYLAELLVLVTGGGFLALSSLFTLGMVIMRTQKQLIRGYVTVFATSVLVSKYFVVNYGISGAAIEYLLLMLFLSLWFAGQFAINVIRKNN